MVKTGVQVIVYLFKKLNFCTHLNISYEKDFLLHHRPFYIFHTR